MNNPLPSPRSKGTSVCPGPTSETCYGSGHLTLGHPSVPPPLKCPQKCDDAPQELTIGHPTKDAFKPAPPNPTGLLRSPKASLGRKMQGPVIGNGSIWLYPVKTGASGATSSGTRAQIRGGPQEASALKLRRPREGKRLSFCHMSISSEIESSPQTQAWVSVDTAQGSENGKVGSK